MGGDGDRNCLGSVAVVYINFLFYLFDKFRQYIGMCVAHDPKVQCVFVFGVGGLNVFLMKYFVTVSTVVPDAAAGYLGCRRFYFEKMQSFEVFSEVCQHLFSDLSVSHGREYRQVFKVEEIFEVPVYE